MAAVSPPSLMREEDYEAIENAVMETSRGRWFLAEFARRNRTADTGVLLEAIGKLEGLMRREHKMPKLERIQLDLADMQEAIARTKREIAQIKNETNDGDRFAEASSELDAIVTQTEGATQDILQKAELVQELAWTLREQGVDEKVCDDIDAHTTDIFMACSFQDLTGQRTQKVVQVLRYLESRIDEMMKIWDVQASEMNVAPDPINPDEKRPDAHLLHGPQDADKAIKQNTVDELMDTQANFMADDEESGSQESADAAFEAVEAEESIDDIEFDAIDTSTEDGSMASVEPGEEAAPEIEAADADSSADSDIAAEIMEDGEEGSGAFDIDDISFDKIDTSDEGVGDEDDGDETAEAAELADDMDANDQIGEDASHDESVAAAPEDAAAQDEAIEAGIAEAEEAMEALVEDLTGAEGVLEGMLDASSEDEFAAFGAGMDAPKSDDVPGEEAGEVASDAPSPGEVEALETEAGEADAGEGFESDEDEDDADAAFMDMETSTSDNDEDDEADPLRALSTGERLALFS